MTDRKLPELIAAALATALGSSSAASQGANETTNEADKNQTMERAGEDVAGAKAGKSYGFVLKGANDFNAAAGVTGAATAKVDTPSDAVNLAP